MQACERYLNAINELVDGTLGPIRRAELELHLDSCDGCRALAEDLQRIARTAGALDPVEPPAGIWQRISTELQREGRIPSGGTVLKRRAGALLALAAAIVIAVASSVFLLTRDERQAPDVQASAGQQAMPPPGPAADPLAGLASEMDLTEKHFQNVLEQADAIVDPQTRAVLQKNWLVMTDALAESRKALEADPQSEPARQSFYDTLRQKIQFLQDTIALMNEMRQGNAAGAAQIVEGGRS